MATIQLRGIAWNHTRGFVPLVATAQRFEELHPGVSIQWEKRSLQAFADAPMERLTESFDLIAIDHPHIALAANADLLLPLDEWIPDDFLADQAAGSVGASHASYQFNGRQWALATDAAAPVATWREDLMQARGLAVPATWADVLELARGGQVGLALFPVDVLMHAYMFCEALGARPFSDDAAIAPREIVEAALEHLRELASLVDPGCFDLDPIRTAERMTRTDAAAYCPFAYGYSNYSRRGYAGRLLTAGGLVALDGRPLRSTLGGAGLAVSRRVAHPRQAADYAAFTAAAQTQRGIYYASGGQPGHRSAWLDPAINADSRDFFSNTLATLDAALVRPAYPGYMHFQDHAAPIAHAAVAGRLPVTRAAAQLQALYQHSHETTAKSPRP
jgi:multiple sugar transport system substrate-binding protein